MAKYISSHNPIHAHTLKRKPNGTVIMRHYGRVDIEFTRMTGGWLRSRTDVTNEATTVVTSAAVANECNHAFGCKESWAKVYQS